MVKAIIFDCFGVLVGTGFKDTYSQAGGNPVRDKNFIDDVLARANMGLITSAQMSQKVADKIGITLESWRGAVASSETPNQKLMAYIGQLKKSYKVAILSNANIGTLQRKFTPEQLSSFDAVVVSAEIGLVKPDPQIYEYAAGKLGVKPSECVFVDDIEHYCSAASRLGMKTIWYRDFEQFKSDLAFILSPV